MLDRIHIHIEVPRVDYEKLSGDRVGQSSDTFHASVQAARNVQRHHFSNNSLTDIVRKADMCVGGYEE